MKAPRPDGRGARDSGGGERDRAAVYSLDGLGAPWSRGGLAGTNDSVVSAGSRPDIQPRGALSSVETAMDYVMTLSGREREVLTLAAEGLTDKQIAQRLRISPNTVKGYIRLALNKLGAVNRREAIELVTLQGLIP
jgi:DNA-binding CsgD family transcriptional regulator